MATLSIQIDDQTKAKLSALAGIKSENEMALVQSAIQNYLDEELDALEDEAIWREYQQNGGVEHERVMLWLEALARGEDAKCPR